MSRPPSSFGRGTPETGWALPIAYWQAQLARARERTAGLRQRLNPDDERETAELTALQELTTTFEELTVAEEELRAQTEELAGTQFTLDAERRRYHELFQHAPVPYIVTDLFGAIRAANAAAERLIGAHQDALVGKPIVIFSRDASRRRLRNVLTKVFAQDVNAEIPLTLTSRRGDVVRVGAVIAMSATATPGRRNADAELRWLFLDRSARARRDRARRRQADRLRRLVAERTAELERTQQLKDRLVATVSHEFRNGLSAIGGYAELLELGLRGGALNEVQLGDVRRIRRAYEHLASIVDDLLNYTRLNAQNLALDIGDVPLADTVAGGCELAVPQALEKGIRIELPQSPSRERIVVRADEERLRQVILNLLVNAVKFTPAPGVVRLLWSADDRHVLVEVRDSGPGIPHEQRDLLFQPYARLGSDAAAPGTGLGLAISRDLMRAMGGDLTIADAPGGGGCLVLRLVRSTGNAAPSPTLETPGPSGTSGTG